MDERLMDHVLNLADIESSAILDSLPDGVYVTDATRRILFWNQAAERITGWAREDVVGHRCHDNILCHVDKDGHRLCGHEHCPLHRAMVTATPSDAARLLFAQRCDGTRIPVEVTVSPVRDADGRVIGGIEVFRDLSPTFQELNRARLIQKDSIGLRLTEDDRYRVRVQYTPHDEVGGDFYRAETLADGRMAMLLADVVGHGISAALYAMQLRSLWEEGRDRLVDPAAFLGWMSRRVETLTDQVVGYFATAAHLVYDPRTGDAVVGTAGHPPPVILRQSGTLERVESGGPGLGLLPDPDFRVASLQLEVGEHLLLFTDGAYEIEDAAGDELGEEALFELIKAADLNRGEAALSQIEEVLLRYSNRLSLPDDLTFLHLQRNA